MISSLYHHIISSLATYLVTNSIVATLPSHAHGHHIVDSMRRRFPDIGPIYYLDTWPFALPALVFISPNLESQYRQDRSFPKHEGMRHFLQSLTGEHDVVTMKGQMWKTWRSIFKPGFSSHHLRTLVPDIWRHSKGASCSSRRVRARQCYALCNHEGIWKSHTVSTSNERPTVCRTKDGRSLISP